MMTMLYPTYTVSIKIKDIPPNHLSIGIAGMQSASSNGNSYKWHNPSVNKTGCDEVLAAVKEALMKAGLVAEISFDRFEIR